MEFGSLFHQAIQSPRKFLDTFVEEPVFVGKTQDGKMSTRSKEAKEFKSHWYAGLKPGTVVVKSNWVEPLVGMLNACLKHRLVGSLLSKGVPEGSLFVNDPETGELLQCRPDFIHEDGLWMDFKTTRDATYPFFHRQIFGSKKDDPFYLLQAAHYTHCGKIAGIGNSKEFLFVAIEKTAPYGIKTWPLDAGALDAGDEHRKRLTALYSQCKRDNIWPCYDERPETAGIPQWFERCEDGP
jgi:exodeoxyribonuclease VIII